MAVVGTNQLASNSRIISPGSNLQNISGELFSKIKLKNNLFYHALKREQ
jgi:hypothetical protein